MKIFIYGSIKKGFYNHERFNFHKLPFLGEKTLKNHCLLNLGVYPGMVSNGNPSDSVKGEVYEIDSSGEDFAFLQEVEENAGYSLAKVEVPPSKKNDEIVYAFLYRVHGGEEKVEGGVWI